MNTGESRPLVVVLAGPNGAGKSTSAAALLRGALTVHEFVNADTIALGLSAYNPEAAAVAAARVMRHRLRRLAELRHDLAFETTLAGRGHRRWLDELRRQGYRRDTRTPAERVDDVDLITEALQRAVREALWEHKRAGFPVVVWRDGRVVWVPPEEIPGPEDWDKR